jgi:hypothetical protein
MNNPVKEADIDGFSELGPLREAIEVRGIEPGIRWKIWPVLLNVLPFKGDGAEVLAKRVAEYQSIRTQWQSMSKCQIKYNALVREAFVTIRVDVKRTNPPPCVEALEEWSVYLIRVLRTYAVWNLDVRYTQGFNDVCVILMTLFVPEIGISLTKEESEALVFWCFAAFVERTASGLIAEDLMVMQSREIGAIMTITERFHPACGQWIKAKSLSDLSFLVSALILSFGRTFDSKVIPRIWETLITSSAPKLFLRYFASSLLILSYPSFLAITNCSIGKLVSQMDAIFRGQNIGNTLGMALSLMKKSSAEIKTKNLTPPIRELKVEIEPRLQSLIQFSTEYSDLYEKLGPLFV